MTELFVYAHPMAENCDPNNMAIAFRTIDVAAQTTQLLAKLFQGKTKMSGDGSQCVQYDDIVIIERTLTDDEQTFIKNTFPFVSIYDRSPIVFKSS